MKIGTYSLFWSVSRGRFLKFSLDAFIARPLQQGSEEFSFSVATALGVGFEPYVEPVFKRSISLIEKTVQQV